MRTPLNVIISVSSDLSTDQRVQKIGDSLVEKGYQVTVLGRSLKSSKPFSSKSYRTKRVKLLFTKGVLFYANLNLRLFIQLMATKADVFYANDLDVLLANYLAARLRNKPIVYDSHEYFTEVPELANRPFVRSIWEKIEGYIVPKLKHCITVTPKIAEIYQEKYGVRFRVVRNFPKYYTSSSTEKKDAILYQGAVNVGRGLEELIDAMPQVKAQLWIAGSGDITNALKRKVEHLGLQDKVTFLGRLAPLELRKYTEQARLGVSIEKQMGLNYTYALPNKIFDYLNATTPVLFSDLSEVKEVLKAYEVGEELISYESTKLAQQLNQMLQSSKYEQWQQDCKAAAREFNWEQEQKVLLSIFEALEK